ncbi:uncharacterized protein LOC106090373 isoform X2 [Stomoxys calcitrans]|uniref:uncharacterized protein LOC106090373 isoform X2 n=1 Tax=Stomoxys calcitrans TaxID=35570 RepID=UPI0027E278C2|nr:uncharacterized protein LOC106090373 isoform X2 [Stomoxys calcitrans]
MNLNNLVFVPSMNSTTTAAAAAIGAANSAPNTNMMVPGAGHFMGKAPPAPPPHHHHHHHAHGGSPNASSAAMYHMRQMASYHQQQQRFYHPQSPPQRSGFSYYHQGPRHFYNNSMMNGRPPLPGLGPHPNANNAGGIWPSLKPGNNYAGISTKAPIASNKLSMDSKESPPPPPNEINKDTLVDTLNATSAGELNTSNNKNNNKPTSASANKAVAPHKKSEKFDKVLNKQLTKHPKIKRSDSKCSMKSTTTTLAVVATVAASTETSSSSSSITTTTNTACVKVVKKDIKQREQHKKKNSMIASRHNPGHRNSTSSEATGSDDLNSSSSNEDLSTTYIVQNKASKKSSKSRQKRQQKRKQNANNHLVGGTNTASDLQPMDIDEDYKENQKPHNNNAHANNGGKTSNSSAAMNLRKQCTKAAALKAALNNSKLPKSTAVGVNALTTSASNSSVCSSLSSASSSSSINSSSLSSSASSSPAHSANSSPTASPTASKRNAEHLKKVAQALLPPPLRQFTKLNLTEAELVQQMRRYVIEPSLLRVYGFPVESVHHEGCIEIYKCLPKHLAEEAITKDNQRHHRHFYGRKKPSGVINAYDGLNSTTQQWSNSTTAIDSGHGSGDSSPRFTDSDSSEMGEEELGYEPVMAFYTPDGVYQIFSEYDDSAEKQCVRCSKMFEVNSEGEYQTFESCTYHWGKANNVYNGKCYVNIYSCCQGEESSEGCSQHPLHVWNGAVVGINGPYNDFVHTKPRSEKQKHKSPKIYAIDCEMSYTGLGLEVTKVSVVGYDGSLVYEHFVRPRAEIIDYNTRFSGISETDLSPNSNNSIKTFAQVQQDLLKLFDADTILIGHGLDNDLRVLRLVHKTIVDTSLIFSHSTGYPYRRSLKNLTKSFLKRDIQCSDLGHSSFEDSRACLELMLWKVRKDLRHWSYQ